MLIKIDRKENPHERIDKFLCQPGLADGCQAPSRQDMRVNTSQVEGMAEMLVRVARLGPRHQSCRVFLSFRMCPGERVLHPKQCDRPAVPTTTRPNIMSPALGQRQ